MMHKYDLLQVLKKHWFVEMHGALLAYKLKQCGSLRKADLPERVYAVSVQRSRTQSGSTAAAGTRHQRTAKRLDLH